jgi:hypothetical protein
LLRHELKQLIAREAEIEHSLQNIEEELDICFASDKDNLARALTRRKLEAQRFQKILLRKRNVLQESLVMSEKQLEENRSRLDSMRQKVDILTEESTSDHPKDNWDAPDISIHEEDVEVAFLREKQRRNLS